MQRRSRIALVTSLGLLAFALLVPQAAMGQKPPPSEQAVRACVEENLARYSSPDEAAVAQYLDLEAACRAALAGDDDVDVQVTPLGARNPESRAGARSDLRVRGARRGRSAPPRLRSRPARTRSSRPIARMETTERNEVASPDERTSAGDVRRAIDDATEAGPPAPGGLSGAPRWLLALLGGLGLLVLAALALRLRRRTN